MLGKKLIQEVREEEARGLNLSGVLAIRYMNIELRTQN
jgi:hypothetical protein